MASRRYVSCKIVTILQEMASTVGGDDASEKGSVLDTLALHYIYKAMRAGPYIY